uniref:G-protein coupled receptor,putative n=1 Tax=Schistosoma mansoni TaxID=6183 RepID=A0A3Q0KIL5_SCHMA
MKKHSNSLSEVFLKVNRNTLNDSNNNNNKQMINQQPDTSQQQQQHNLKDKLANILRKHSFHTLSPYTYIKPSELTQSRRSTGRTDKDTKFNDIITLRRCALMPLNNNTACSSISNEYMNSGRNSENLSNLSTTFITPRNSNQLDRLTNITQDQLYSSTSTNYNGNNKLKRSIEFKAISMFLFNLSSILLCWLPYYTLFLFTDHLPNLCLSFTVYEFFYWLRFLCIAFNPLIYGSASEDLRKAFKRFILHCGKVKHEKKALKRLVLAGLGAAGIPYGHRIIIPQQMKSSDYNQQQQQNRSVIFNKPLMIIADMDDKT